MKSLNKIIDKIEAAGGEVFYVGGFVRDELWGYESKDYDLEVFGLSYKQLHDMLSPFYKVGIVGKDYGVMKVMLDDDLDIDISIPRRERKVGIGHKAFKVTVDHTLSYYEASKRRDFTINAIMKRPDGEVIDPHYGKIDLDNRILRHVDAKTFTDDPLRVERGFQFISRFGLRPTEKLIDLCLKLRGEYHSLPKERIWGEWEKWASKGIYPSSGIKFLVDCGWISPLHTPQIYALKGIPQNPEWHPEGDVFVHTMMVVDYAARIAIAEKLDPESRMILVLAALCHDFGKPATTRLEGGVWRAPSHDVEGVQPTYEFLEEIGCPIKYREPIATLVRYHMQHLSYRVVTPRNVRRLMHKLDKGGTSIEMLGMLVNADCLGSSCDYMPIRMSRIMEQSENIEVEDVVNPILKGRHLIQELGMKPSTSFGKILNTAMQGQIDGEFRTPKGGLAYIKTFYGDELYSI